MKKRKPKVIDFFDFTVYDNPVFDRIEKRKVLQTSVDVGLEHFLFIS